MQYDRGYISPYFVTNQEKMIAELDNPVILIFEKKLSALQPLLPLLEQIVQSQRPLLIIAEDVEGEALATLVVNKMRGGLKVAATKNPGFGDRSKDMIDDISILTGGIVVREELDVKLENLKLQQLGKAQKIVITKDHTTIIGGANKGSEAVETRCNQIKRRMEEPGISSYDKEKLQERLAKLSGGVAIIKVGGATEVEVKERKDRVEDALNATRAAVEEEKISDHKGTIVTGSSSSEQTIRKESGGIVAGGGVALFYAARVLENLTLDNPDQQAGVKMMRRALEYPIRQIAENSGIDGAAVVSKLSDSKDYNYGYNAQTGEYVDMIKAGIIDPTKVTSHALLNAASVAGLLLTTEAVVTDNPEDKEPAAAGPRGGMGGMGGMDF